MDDYDSQSTVEDVSEWAEHIEDVIEELQRNYKIIQTEMNCLVEKLQVVNHKQRSNYLSRRVVIPGRRIGKSYYRTQNLNNENNWNINRRGLCSNCNNIQNQRGYITLGDKNSSINNSNNSLINEEYINELIKEKFTHLESSILEKLERNCNSQHIEFQRNLTDLKIQESITESTVKDIALQIQEVAVEVKEIKKTNMENINKINCNISSKNDMHEHDRNILLPNIVLNKDRKSENCPKNCVISEYEDVIDNDCSSCCSSCSCSSCCNSTTNVVNTCIQKNTDLKSENLNLIRTLKNLFVEHDNLVDIDSNLSEMEFNNIILLRQMFRDNVKILTQDRIQSLEDSIGDIKHKNTIYEKSNEISISDMKKLINDELLNKNTNDNKINKLQNDINNVLIDLSNMQNDILNIDNKLKKEVNENEKELNEKMCALERELINRSELIKEAVRELNDEYKNIKLKLDSENIDIFGNELLSHIGEKLSSIKELISYIGQDIFDNEDKLQRQIKKNSVYIQELKDNYFEFEKYTDANIHEIENSMKEFRIQIVSILSSICDTVNINTGNIQVKLKDYSETNNIKLEHLLDESKWFSHSRKQILEDKSEDNIGQVTSKSTSNVDRNSNSSLLNSIPPNAYHINNV